MSTVVGGLDRIEAVFDDGSVVGDGGLVLVGTLVGRLGLEGLVGEAVRPPGAGRGSGAKVLAAVCSMLVGGSFFSDADRLRAGSAGAVVGFAVVGFAPVAPSTLGTFARSFAWGRVRRLDRVGELVLGRAWAAGAAPAAKAVTVDVDSTLAVVRSDAKHGAAYGHGERLGYHPLIAARDDTGEIVHSPMRKSSSQRGNVGFAAETLRRVRRLAPDAALMLRADTGFLSWDLIDKLEAHDTRFAVAVAPNPSVTAAVAAIGAHDWDTDRLHRRRRSPSRRGHSHQRPTRRGQAQATVRLVMRRTRLAGGQAELWPNWRHHAVATDIDADGLDTKAADTACRAHARVEQAIRDIKAGGLAHSPSGRFAANASRLAFAALAHNIARWAARIEKVHEPHKPTVGATLARRLPNIAGRLDRRSGRPTLRLPAR
ncbi:IS1380 family transposase [Candidatus Poriferisodalis sp.]|uniref:IS1380 family transposase n=1 Tax=Candidatus Poriferisodalis sp. TaxID=3101277 RepID=UPI003B02CDD1